MDTPQNSSSSEERLDIFASVQYDPEVWDLVQKKFHRFEDLDRQLEEALSRRRDLTKQLAETNDTIADLQQQLVVLAGKEKVESELLKEPGAEAADASTKSDSEAMSPLLPTTETEEAADAGPMVGLAPMDEDQEPTAETEVKPSEAQESVMAWPGIDQAQNSMTQAGSQSDPVQAETSDEVKAELEPYQPVAEAEAEAKPSTVSFSEPIKDEPAAPAATAEPVAAMEPVAAAEKPAEPADLPAEVHELQQLFDGADDQRRQSDSALKLVQLYDGKVEVFFAAMCRSHQQNGLDEADARREAVKDVQTMIATAKSHADKSVAANDTDKQKNAGGSMRRLFSH
jgi:hypothetical protein